MRKLLIEDLLNRTHLEKLLCDSYGNYCVQVRDVIISLDVNIDSDARSLWTTLSPNNVHCSLKASVLYCCLSATPPTANVFRASCSTNKWTTSAVLVALASTTSRHWSTWQLWVTKASDCSTEAQAQALAICLGQSTKPTLSPMSTASRMACTLVDPVFKAKAPLARPA